MSVPAVVAVGFATTVAMWAVGYVGRLPATMIDSPWLLLLLLVCPVVGGILIGRHGGGRVGGGALAGGVSGLVNLLVLLSFLSGESRSGLVPSAWIWIPGSVLLSGLLATAGAAVGCRWPRGELAGRDWLGAHVKVAAAATLLLLAVGGLVTSAEAGLAVIDWPRSFGYNMFLYPFSRMTGGIYYEHAHRLFGALVGLTTLVMALLLQRIDPRRWVRGLGWGALGLVVVQGVLGGVRVTERSVALAMVHGIVAQVFFATIVALAVFTSATWRRAGPAAVRPSVRADRRLGCLLVALILVQLVLGAAQRHYSALLFLHMLTGVALVVPLAIHVGTRSLSLNPGQRPLRRLGGLLVAGVAVQVALGFLAFLVTGATGAGRFPRGIELVVATVHQWFGAVLLATAVTLLCLSWRLVVPGPRPD